MAKNGMFANMSGSDWGRMGVVGGKKKAGTGAPSPAKQRRK